ncbi:MAG: TAXI family TRAP transporter solute-binding subunit [Bradyrhizobiaceae bacterium]|nr:MAG: TAXI family TRAP transporter solute-binding subunit [Bradyrhizobiaceae bacterium]
MARKNIFSRSLSSPPPRTIAAARASRARLRSLMVVLAILVGIGAIVGGIYYYVTRPITLRIAVGPANSDDVRVVQSLAQTFARDHAHIRLRPIVTEGAVESADLLSSGKTDLAVLRGDIDLPKNAEAVAYLRKNFAVLWAPGGSRKNKITSIKQLAGKRIGVIGRTKANVNLLNIVLEQSGVAPDKVQVVQFPTNNISEALKNQKLDAYLAVGPLNSRITADAISATARDGAELNFLSIDTADAIAEKFSAYESAEIPAGTFSVSPPRPDDTVTTINFGHHFVARKSLSDTTVAAFARQLFGARQAILSEFPAAAKIETPDTDKDASIPVHPGAAAYIDGEEKTFLDKYSDYMWGGIMILSVMGSVFAWFAGYLRKDERSNNSSMRERLLEMLTEARKSHSLEELDAMQAEADIIMRDTLHCFEDGAIEEGSLTAFSIALEQFHNAVADRKLLLISLPEQSRPPRPHVA